MKFISPSTLFSLRYRQLFTKTHVHKINWHLLLHFRLKSSTAHPPPCLPNSIVSEGVLNRGESLYKPLKLHWRERFLISDAQMSQWHGQTAQSARHCRAIVSKLNDRIKNDSRQCPQQGACRDSRLHDPDEPVAVLISRGAGTHPR